MNTNHPFYATRTRGYETPLLPDETFDTERACYIAIGEELQDRHYEQQYLNANVPMRITNGKPPARHPVLAWCPLPYRPEHHSPIVVR